MGLAKRNLGHAFYAQHTWYILLFDNQAACNQHQCSKHRLYRHPLILERNIFHIHHTEIPIDLHLTVQAEWFSRIVFGTHFRPIFISLSVHNELNSGFSITITG